VVGAPARDPGGQLVGRRSSSGSQHYYLFDALGSVVGLATTSGTLEGGYRYTYDPYGNQTSAEPALGNPWRYAGGLYMDDVATGTKLTKFGTRYYDPSVGRWTQQDPVAGSIDDPGSLNRYVYVGDDPVNFTDPAGLLRLNVSALGCAILCAGVSVSIGGGPTRVTVSGGAGPAIGAGAAAGPQSGRASRGSGSTLTCFVGPASGNLSGSNSGGISGGVGGGPGAGGGCAATADYTF
jgi:RHS repeat-associated protein